MAKEQPVPKQPSTVLTFARKNLTFPALRYYSAVFFAGAWIGIGVRALWGHDWVYALISAMIIGLFVEVAYYRYYAWKPEKSKQFALGATAVVDVVHTEGILRYRRNGQEYALYSNLVGNTVKNSEAGNADKNTR